MLRLTLADIDSAYEKSGLIPIRGDWHAVTDDDGACGCPMQAVAQAYLDVRFDTAHCPLEELTDADANDRFGLTSPSVDAFVWAYDDVHEGVHRAWREYAQEQSYDELTPEEYAWLKLEFEEGFALGEEVRLAYQARGLWRTLAELDGEEGAE